MHFSSTISMTTLSLLGLASALTSGVFGQSSGSGVVCTYHDYEGLVAQQGLRADNAPGWCGIRYSGLNVKRVVAVGFMNTANCNKCLKITGASIRGPAVYALAIDLKTGGGLDLAQTIFQEAFPTQNPLDPQKCDWEVVDDCYCSGVCWASKEECTVGVRNLLMASLLPPVGTTNVKTATCSAGSGPVVIPSSTTATAKTSSKASATTTTKKASSTKTTTKTVTSTTTTSKAALVGGTTMTTTKKSTTTSGATRSTARPVSTTTTRKSSTTTKATTTTSSPSPSPTRSSRRSRGWWMW